jgi:hypothetical protein
VSTSVERPGTGKLNQAHTEYISAAGELHKRRVTFSKDPEDFEEGSIGQQSVQSVLTDYHFRRRF